MISAEANLRLGLAGGGTDVSPYPEMFGGRVVNLTIDRRVLVNIKRRDGEVFFHSVDQNSSQVFSNSPYRQQQLPLHQGVHDYFVSLNGSEGLLDNLIVESKVEAPLGSGLGTSSTLSVALTKAYCKLLQYDLNASELAETAYEIERERCGFSGGKQDHYAASFGGLNFIEFNGGRSTTVHKLQVDDSFLEEFQAQAILVFSGTSRSSSEIISEQMASVMKPKGAGLEAMHMLRQEAVEAELAIKRGSLKDLYLAIRRGWEAKRLTSSAVSTPLLEKVIEGAISLGAYCGKVSGAGGGGFILLFAPVEKRNEICNFLMSFNLNPESIKATMEGAR